MQILFKTWDSLWVTSIAFTPKRGSYLKWYTSTVIKGMAIKQNKVLMKYL